MQKNLNQLHHKSTEKDPTSLSQENISLAIEEIQAAFARVDIENITSGIAP